MPLREERGGRGCQPVWSTGYTGIMESVAIAASPAVGLGGPGAENAWPSRLYYIRWLFVPHYIPHLGARGYWAVSLVPFACKVCRCP